MKLFEEFFPNGSTVATTFTSEGVLRVRVFGPRPSPVWINGSPNRKRGPLTDEEQVRKELLALVRIQPGHSRTHYERWSLKDGGAKGSQARKEEIMDKMIEEGLVQQVKLDPPQGRRTHVLHPVDERKG